MSNDPWNTIHTLAALFAQLDGGRGLTPEEQWTLQVLKISEEVGEADHLHRGPGQQRAPTRHRQPPRTRRPAHRLRPLAERHSTATGFPLIR
ncbi:hypothetical protein ACWGLB_37085 [Streptomyces sp. NPDC055893]